MNDRLYNTLTGFKTPRYEVIRLSAKNQAISRMQREFWGLFLPFLIDGSRNPLLLIRHDKECLLKSRLPVALPTTQDQLREREKEKEERGRG